MAEAVDNRLSLGMEIASADADHSRGPAPRPEQTESQVPTKKPRQVGPDGALSVSPPTLAKGVVIYSLHLVNYTGQSFLPRSKTTFPPIAKAKLHINSDDGTAFRFFTS